MRVNWTDPALTDSLTPAPGETNINRASHVSELRAEIEKLSLFAPHLDERPLRCAAGQSVFPALGGAENVLLDTTGSGCVRTIWFVALSDAGDGGRIKIYVDGEATPRVDCSWREWAFALDAAPFMSDHMGLVAPGPHFANTVGTYRHTPIPFHSRIRIVHVSTATTGGAGRYWFQVAYNHSATVDFNYGRYRYFNTTATSQTMTAGGGGAATVLDVAKRGALYGAYLHMTFTDSTLLPLEGDLDVYVDNEATPSYRGSGTEDVPLLAFYFQPFADSANAEGDFKNPTAATRPLMLSRTSGVTHLELRTAQTNIAGMYRYWDVSPLPFESRAIVTWQNTAEDADVVARSVLLYYTGT